MAKKETVELTAYKNGLAKALELVKAGGIEALEDEIKFRNITYCPAYVSKNDYLKWEREVTGNACESITMLMLLCARDEFDFGPKRLRRLMNRFNSYSDNINGDYIDWQGIIDCIEDEGQISIDEVRNVFSKEATCGEGKSWPEQKKLRNGTEG